MITYRFLVQLKVVFGSVLCVNTGLLYMQESSHKFLCQGEYNSLHTLYLLGHVTVYTTMYNVRTAQFTKYNIISTYTHNIWYFYFLFKKVITLKKSTHQLLMAQSNAKGNVFEISLLSYPFKIAVFGFHSHAPRCCKRTKPTVHYMKIT